MNHLQKVQAAQNPGTSTEVLEELANDKSWSIRSHVAENPNTPLETLQQLATDKDCSVRYFVTQNPNRTELIERLVLMTDYHQSN